MAGEEDGARVLRLPGRRGEGGVPGGALTRTRDALEVALAVALRGGRVLVTKRAADVHLGGFWEFPGGKIEPGEEPRAAARRELAEETGLAGGTLEPLLVHEFDYPDRTLRFHVYLIREPEGEPAGPAQGSWLGPEELETLAMPPANAPILRALRWRLAR